MRDAKQATPPSIGARVTFDGELWEIVALGSTENALCYAQLVNVARPALRIGRWLGKAAAA